MTPKEKAAELVKQFDECLNHIAIGSNGIEDHLLERAKACALICVDEILNSRPSSPCEIGLVDWAQWEQAKQYWQEVKNEILKM